MVCKVDEHGQVVSCGLGILYAVTWVLTLSKSLQLNNFGNHLLFCVSSLLLLSHSLTSCLSIHDLVIQLIILFFWAKNIWSIPLFCWNEYDMNKFYYKICLFLLNNNNFHYNSKWVVGYKEYLLQCTYKQHDNTITYSILFFSLTGIYSILNILLKEKSHIISL